MATGTLVATSSFAATVKDVEVIVREGDEIPANHPVVKGREHFFEQILARALPVIGGRRGRAG